MLLQYIDENKYSVFVIRAFLINYKRATKITKNIVTTNNTNTNTLTLTQSGEKDNNLINITGMFAGLTVCTRISPGMPLIVLFSFSNYIFSMKISNKTCSTIMHTNCSANIQ